MLRVDSILVKYGGLMVVLSEVSLEVKPGGLVALLGANGAGKSTTLKAISGLLKVESGEVAAGKIEFEGIRIDKKGPQEIARMGVIQVVEGRRVCQHLTTEENLLAGSLIGRREGIKKRLGMVYDCLPRLKDLRKQTSGYLSGGEQQMLVIGRALMARPKLMLLDEPYLGLSPIMAKEISQIVQRISIEEKMAILLVEQNASLALSVAEFAYVLEMGRIALQGSSSEIQNNRRVQEFYLGLDEKGKRKSYREVKRYRSESIWSSSQEAFGKLFAADFTN